MTKRFPGGVYPTMLLPLTDDNRVDYPAIRPMIEWYAARGSSGLFAMCHSTEMHLLSMDERLGLLREVRKSVDGIARALGKPAIPVVAAGTFSASQALMRDEILRVADAGADAVVWITNRLDPLDQGDEVWLSNADRLLESLPEGLALGVYECPQPYKRLMSQRMLSWCAETGRFAFLKDTCCDAQRIEERLRVIGSGGMRLFNANAQTLLETLRAGASGYCSVMANIHPHLYAWLCENYAAYPDLADKLQRMLCFTSFAESLSYPLIAKYCMRRDGVPIAINSRMRPREQFTPYHRGIMEQLRAMTRDMWASLPNTKGVFDDDGDDAAL